MCVATDFAMIGTETIRDSVRRDEILERLSETGREIITLSNEQIADFSGNALELTGRDGRILALSTRAFDDCSRHYVLVNCADQLVGGFKPEVQQRYDASVTAA